MAKFSDEIYVVGVTHEDRQKNLEELKVINAGLPLKTKLLLTLKADENNEFDKNAVMVLYNDKCLGYIPQFSDDEKTMEFSSHFKALLQNITECYVLQIYINQVGKLGLKIKYTVEY